MGYKYFGFLYIEYLFGKLQNCRILVSHHRNELQIYKGWPSKSNPPMIAIFSDPIFSFYNYKPH